MHIGVDGSATCKKLIRHASTCSCVEVMQNGTSILSYARTTTFQFAWLRSFLHTWHVQTWYLKLWCNTCIPTHKMDMCTHIHMHVGMACAYTRSRGHSLTWNAYAGYRIPAAFHSKCARHSNTRQCRSTCITPPCCRQHSALLRARASGMRRGRQAAWREVEKLQEDCLWACDRQRLSVSYVRGCIWEYLHVQTYSSKCHDEYSGVNIIAKPFRPAPK